MFYGVIHERSLTSGKEYTLYHGTSNPNIDIMLANSYNSGKRYENNRMSSYWFLVKDFAIAFAAAELVNENSDNINILIDNDMKFIIVDKYRTEAINILKHNNSYVYYLNIDGKYVTGGQSRYFPEYTIDFPVKPTGVETVDFNIMKNYIKFVPESYWNKIIEDFKQDKMRFGANFFNRIIDPILYPKNMDIIQNKKTLKKFTK